MASLNCAAPGTAEQAEGEASGADGRPKKQMNFSSRAEMIRYIENFRINYKTEMCRNWVQTGECEFAKDCAYAHGYTELNRKPSSLHKNYKTKMCKKWHISTPGKCSYGEKCQFIHDEYSYGLVVTEPQPSIGEEFNSTLNET
mmetsp:Transcript_14516/g.24780  ORF Transcript_14516/g.24780 Transcript_14516/m.24780 type:complete len:143 (+) Transcript_14516:272-700(+)